ncbi:MAG: 6-phosphogluconolactonase [Planctomycetota bacterium]
MMRTFSDTEILDRAATYHILSMTSDLLQHQSRVSLVLAGGGTPLGTYREMVRAREQWEDVWDHIDFYWGDERYVPHSHKESNYRGAHRALLRHLPISPDQVHPIPTEQEDPEEAARRYEEVFPERPDILLAGIGEDGHTLSLFPGSPALHETDRRVVAVEAPTEPPRRITLTPPTVGSARQALVLVKGGSKADAVKRIHTPEGSIDETPARLLRDAEWFVDRAAAGQLDEEERE